MNGKFSAALAPTLDSQSDKLLATVLEPDDVHAEIYKSSTLNTNTIRNAGHAVKFGVDATNLTEIFGNDRKFDKIQFNFPHWRGKANNRYNRELLRDFFVSAAEVLSRKGEIHIALFSHQVRI